LGRTSARSLAKNCFYPIIVRGDEIVDFGPRCEDDFHPGKANVVEGDLVYVYPVEGSEATGDYSERKWVFSRNTVEANKEQLFVRRGRRRSSHYATKVAAKVSHRLDDKRYYANIYGSKALTNVMGSLSVPLSQGDSPG
jgi:adenine-specific DNA-methyltransferase